MNVFKVLGKRSVPEKPQQASKSQPLEQVGNGGPYGYTCWAKMTQKLVEGAAEPDQKLWKCDGDGFQLRVEGGFLAIRAVQYQWTSPVGSELPSTRSVQEVN